MIFAGADPNDINSVPGRILTILQLMTERCFSLIFATTGMRLNQTGTNSKIICSSAQRNDKDQENNVGKSL